MIIAQIDKTRKIFFAEFCHSVTKTQKFNNENTVLLRIGLITLTLITKVNIAKNDLIDVVSFYNTPNNVVA